MDIAYLESLEKKYDFQYPKLYKQLCQDGMLDTGKYGTGWVSRNYDRIKDHPIFLIWSSDVELIEEFELEEYIEDMKDPDMWNLKPELNLVPFASNGGGDWYCFYYNEQQGDDVPIVIMNHDGDTADILAKHLQDFIFRQLLETASNYYISADELKNKAKVVWDLRSMFNSHKKYLTEKQITILEEVFAKEMIEYEEDTWGMITSDEAYDIIKQEIDFPLLDEDFEYYQEQE